jgi:hypothetical protein
VTGLDVYSPSVERLSRVKYHVSMLEGRNGKSGSREGEGDREKEKEESQRDGREAKRGRQR